MDLSVSIVSWNTRDLLDQCLRSIFETTHGIDFEVIVVDNESSDGSADMVRAKYARVLLIENDENVGFARANNQAFKVAQGRYFTLLNPDTYIKSGLDEAVKYMDCNLDVGVLGCKSLNPDGSVQISWNKHYPSLFSEVLYNGIRDRRRIRDPQIQADKRFPAAWVGGVCMTVRRTAAQQVGLLDEGYFMYSEETDWCRRFAEAGWRVMHSPCVTIVHFGGQSSKQAPIRARVELARSKVRFISKFRSRPEAKAYIAFLSISGLLKWCFFSVIGVFNQGDSSRVTSPDYWRALRREYRRLGTALYCGEQTIES